MKDKIHFFGNYEYEREPSTQTYTTGYPSFNKDLTGTRTDPKGGGRVDFQFSPKHAPYGARQHVAALHTVRSALHGRRHPNAIVV